LKSFPPSTLAYISLSMGFLKSSIALAIDSIAIELNYQASKVNIDITFFLKAFPKSALAYCETVLLMGVLKIFIALVKK